MVHCPFSSMVDCVSKHGDYPLLCLKKTTYIGITGSIFVELISMMVG